MVYPNAYCIGFCYWMLNVSWQQLTPSRLTLITAVYNAALSGSSVTALQYNNFTQLTSWRKPYYDSYLASKFNYTTNATGICDFWFSSQYLVYNSINFSGQIRPAGSVSLLSDIKGGLVTGANSNLGREPYLTLDNTIPVASQLFGFNKTGLSFFQLSNAGALIQNKTGYTCYVVAKATGFSGVPVAIYFSAGATVAQSRFEISCGTTGNWQGKARRLDADATGSVGAVSATGALQIVCFSMDYATGIGKFYINGILKGTTAGLTTLGSTSNTASTNVWIGSLNTSQIWEGLISDVLGYQTAHDQSTVTTVTTWLNSMRQCF